MALMEQVADERTNQEREDENTTDRCSPSFFYLSDSNHQFNDIKVGENEYFLRVRRVKNNYIFGQNFGCLRSIFRFM